MEYIRNKDLGSIPVCLFKWFLPPSKIYIYIYIYISLFVCFWLLWVFNAAHAFLQLRRVRATLQLECSGFSLWWLLVAEHRFWGMQASVLTVFGLQTTGSVVVAHRLRCSAACWIFLDKGSNLCLLQWQVDYLPLSHQGSLLPPFL